MSEAGAQAPPTLVADLPGLERLLGAVRDEAMLALDSESNSFHAYRERVCLLQISTRRGDWVVDPLAVDVRPLGEMLCDGRETVLHGADYDVRCLSREYGWRFPRLFDTMAAARRLGAPGLGLSALVESHFGVRLSKAHQRSDWGRRPLTREQIAYAALDTHYLLPLRDRLAGEIEARGLEAAAREEFSRIAGAEARERIFDAEGWRRIRGARGIDPAGAKVLRALWLAREAQARALDRPPFKVLAEATLVEIARRRPASPGALRGIPGITESVLRRMGEAITSALRAEVAPAPPGRDPTS